MSNQTQTTEADNLFFVEFTDTYAGEANYCWTDRYKVKANSLQQAITKAKQQRYTSPLPRHTTSNYGDSLRIDINGANVCAFCDYWDDDRHAQYLNLSYVDC